MTEKVFLNSGYAEKFANDFLEHYLKNGIGAMSKSDVDALVMHLIDNYSQTKKGELFKSVPNQSISQILRTPVSKIKRLRYDAGLKYEENSEEEAKKRFINCLKNVSLEIDEKKQITIILILEDYLAKHWIQARIKENQTIYDGSFNSEIIKVKIEDFIKILKIVLDPKDVESFKKKYEPLKLRADIEEVKRGFKDLVKEILKGVIAETVKTVIP
jgi:hypothetical protein